MKQYLNPFTKLSTLDTKQPDVHNWKSSLRGFLRGLSIQLWRVFIL